MKIKISKETKDSANALILAGAVLIAFYFLLKNLVVFKNAINTFLTMCFPFLLGLLIAVILNPLVKWIETEGLKNTKFKSETKRKIAAIAALLFLILVVIIIVSLIVPQLLNSAITLSSQMHDYILVTSTWAEEIMQKYNINSTYLSSLLDASEDIVGTGIDLVVSYIPTVISNSMKIASTFANIFIGLIVALYIMLSRETYLSQVNKVMNAFFSEKIVEFFYDVVDLSVQMLNKFIVGKALDSLIIGLICFICMVLFQMPYPILISTIVGVTNMIPVFGPFIGAVPAIFIIFIVNPMQAVFFAIYILVLQQIDGNIIGPKILGNSVGLTGLWTLFAIVIGGKLFGIVGMFFGVPVFAVIYVLTREYVYYRLDQKNQL